MHCIMFYKSVYLVTDKGLQLIYFSIKQPLNYQNFQLNTYWWLRIQVWLEMIVCYLTLVQTSYNKSYNYIKHNSHGDCLKYCWMSVSYKLKMLLFSFQLIGLIQKAIPFSYKKIKNKIWLIYFYNNVPSLNMTIG